MKFVLRTLLATCICLLLANKVSSLSSTQVGDIFIQKRDDGSFYCDSMICPEGTAKCRVTKRNDPNDSKMIIRHRSCMALNGGILQEQKINEPNKSLGNVNINVESGGSSSRPMTPEEKKEFDEYMKKTRENVKAQINAAINKAHASMGSFLDGSFEANLKNEINSNLASSFQNWK